MDQLQKPRLHLFRNLSQAVAFIEDMTGEKMTPEEVEELRLAMPEDDDGLLPASAAS
jgi:hypothetical protein